MKVRILGNTIRLRVKMHEAENLNMQGIIEEVVEFGPQPEQQLRFRVQKGADHFSIIQNDMTVSMVIPSALIDAWATTEQVGIEEMMATPHGRYIKVLLEKDFACLDTDREAEEGSYPNPLETCS